MFSVIMRRLSRIQPARPELTLKKKHQAIAYQSTHEAQAAGAVLIAKEAGW